MELKFKWFAQATILAAAALTATAHGNEEVEEAKGEYCGICEAKKRFHELVPWLEMGADLRLRSIYDQGRTLQRRASGHDRFWHRWRGRVWAKVTPLENLEFNIRVVAEPRYYCRPDNLERQLIRHEALFDRLNVKVKNVFGLPVTATVGRQDMKLGNGWLVNEGTPRDGSRTIHFDAVRLTAELKDIKTTADVIFIDNHANSSAWIHPFNDRGLDLSEQDEQGAIFYVSNEALGDTKIDGYFIYKRDHNRTPSGVEGESYTFGALVERRFNESWECSTEFAPQFGHKNGKPLCAFGTINKVTYSFRDPMANALSLTYEYVSGARDRDQNFDHLWARNARWSDLYNGGIDGIDGRSDDSSNLHRLALGWGCEPTKTTELQANYHLLFADDSTSAAGTNGLSRHGHFRGQLFTAQAKHTVNEHFSHRVNAELFCPGNFYNSDRNDPALWVRYEILLSW